MSSNQEEQLPNSLPSIQQPQSISQLAQIGIEEPHQKKMRLMFGEGQVVFIRSDGLRSRMVRSKKNRKEKSESRTEVEQPSDSATLDEVIEDVSSGRVHQEGNGSSSPSLTLPDVICHGVASGSDTVEKEEKLPLNALQTKMHSEMGEPSRIKKKRASGNRSYHPPKEFHGTSTMSTHKRKWTYQTSCMINADEQKDDNQIGYAPNPFLPMPRGRKNETSTAARMNYAAQRVENRKYRGQAKTYQAVKNTPDRDSITCEKCKMKYFSESKNIQERISYLPSANEEVLPIVVFDCPVCKEVTNAAF